MSIQEQFGDLARNAQTARWVFDALSMDRQTRFVAANSNRNWALSFSKRVLDLAISFPALIAVLPLLVMLGMLIRLDSAGPVLFRQKRLGLNGLPFHILKLRTMTVLENGSTIVQASADDTRTTRIGRWLRAFSIDELPQLVNVVRGDMSLVGPRPHAWAHDDHYASLIPHYRCRQSVKPGLTGWAQINGLRGPTPTVEIMAARVDHDVWYANHAGFALDLKILLSTPLEVLRHRNAH